MARRPADGGLRDHAERVGLSTTAEAVNQVLSEKEAGVASGGAVDLVWINGENFRTMKAGDLLFLRLSGQAAECGLG